MFFFRSYAGIAHIFRSHRGIFRRFQRAFWILRAHFISELRWNSHKGLKELIPLKTRDDQHRLSVADHVPFPEHLRRLDMLREHLLVCFRKMSLEEFRRPRHFPEYDVTPEWVLHHLIQHEAEHRGHIQMLRSLAERTLEAPKRRQRLIFTP